MRLLDERQFRDTFSYPMRQVEPDPAALRELPTAVQAVPEPHLLGFVLDGLSVESVQRAETGIFEHYLVRTTTPNVFLALVWDRTADRFHGYHLLDLNEKYGLPTPAARGPAPEPQRAAEPMDYRPPSADAAARRWPLWAGLAVVLVFAAIVIHLNRATSPPVTAPPPPPPRPVFGSPATFPTTQPIPVVPAGPMTRPTTGPERDVPASP